MTRPATIIVLALLAFGGSKVAAVSLRLDAATAWAENINRATAASDWRDAQKFGLYASASLLREWHAGFITSGTLDAGIERVNKYSLLDTITAGASAQVRQKFGFGALAPALSVEAGLHARGARLDDNDGWTATAGVSLAKRLSPSWRVAGVGDWQQHYARAAIFDTKHHRAFGTVTWYLNERWSLTHGSGRLWGSFTASASPAVWPRALAGALGSNVSSYYNTIHWGVTNAYGPGWITYLVDGRVSFWWLELAPAIGRNTSLPLRYESLVSINKAGVKYRQDVWTLQILHRF